MNKAFTLIELLAVIAILAIILLIAVPMVLSTIASSKQAAFKENAQMVIKTVDLKTASDSTFDYRTLTAGNITTKLGLDNSNYLSLSVTKQYGKTKVIIVGQGSWNGLTAYGTTDAMYAVNSSSFSGSVDGSGANPPEMSSNMIPVYYDSTCNSGAGCWEKADVNNLDTIHPWYKYDSKIWANAVTVTDASRSGYQSATVGSQIAINDILTFMVWIPRYKYYIDSTNKLIYPVFESTLTPKSIGNATNSSTYLTHPAFTFGSQELGGFWFSKFELTGSISSITSKPGLQSLDYQGVSSYFTAIRNMEASGNAYGYIASEVDSHMMLNSEWGAVAYLSDSTYGKNSEVWINPNSNYITGQAGTSVSAAATTSTYAYNDMTYGVNASTTGNVYGIYDMSGCYWEFTMGNYNNGSGYSSSSNSGFSGYNGGDSSTTVGLAFPASQYYNLYTTNVPSTACGGGVCYGQALSETSGWNSDWATFPSVSAPWLIRSGTSGNTTGAGLFYYYNIAGNGDVYGNTRIVQIET